MHRLILKATDLHWGVQVSVEGRRTKEIKSSLRSRVSGISYLEFGDNPVYVYSSAYIFSEFSVDFRYCDPVFFFKQLFANRSSRLILGLAFRIKNIYECTCMLWDWVILCVAYCYDAGGLCMLHASAQGNNDWDN